MSADTEFDVTIDEIVDTFAELDAWDERYGYLIELGDLLPPLPDADRVRENKVDGCLSTVWLVARICPPDAEEQSLELRADSDAAIVRGLIAILLALYSGQTRAAILNIDPEPLFGQLGLQQHLSATRRNGLRAMVRRIQQLAASRNGVGGPSKAG